MSTDEDAIRELLQDWHRATAAGDLDRILTLISSDVVFLTAGQAPLGRDEFEQRLGSLFQTHRIESSAEIQELVLSGDLAYCWSFLTVHVHALSGAATQQRRGHVLSVLRKHSNGRWQIARDANLLGTG